MDDCLFCKIIRKEIMAEIIYEDDCALAFLDVHPRTLGHTLVVPKLHVAVLGELPEELLAPYFGAVKKVLGHTKEVLHPDGVTIGINEGRASGQEVQHLHAHLMSRFLTDKGGSLQSVVNNPPQESLTETGKRLRISD